MTKSANREFWSEPVGSLTLQKALTVKSDTAVADAVRLMQEKGKGCVCVQDDTGAVVGIFTERDVMVHFIGQSLSPNTPVDQVMTPDPVMVNPETPLAEAIEVFYEHKFHHLPVLNGNGRLKGLLSIRVAVDFVAENLPGEVLNRPPDASLTAVEEGGG